MLKNLSILFLVLIIPIVVLAQTKQSGSQAQKERVVLVTVEKVTEGISHHDDNRFSIF